MIRIVVGTAYGDEGKGQCVHSLAHAGTLVIRFSGGHQCGHTVTTPQGVRHVFSTFGAGAFRDASSYTGEYCTIYPVAYANELQALQTAGLQPVHYAHPLAMITTPYDLAFNRATAIVTGHGTCGVGFGATLRRNRDFYHLFAQNLFNTYVTETKLQLTGKYYEEQIKPLNMSSRIVYENELETAMEDWEPSLAALRQSLRIACLDELAPRFTDHIFEGSQGILLDRHFGFFPHVTPSNTTTQNALEIIHKTPFLQNQPVETHYMSRCYLTRHGHGPMPSGPIELVNTHTESNLENDWQGVFRTAKLDFALLQYAVNCDTILNRNSAKILTITCLDQLKDRQQFMDELETSGIRDMFREVRLRERADWE